MQLDDEASLADYLDAAWKNLRKIGGDRDLPDIITLEDVAAEWPSFRAGIVSRVTTDRYSLSHVDVLDLPKDPLNVRPMARLALEDRLVYDACVLAMLPTIDAVIPGNVYSYRWSKYKQSLYSPISHWMDMQKRGRRFHRSHQELLMLRTDVTSFYEYVDIETLRSDLGELRGVPDWSLSLLQTFLEQFNGSSHAWGIPQGADSSGVLANLYLLPIDKYLRSRHFAYVRYSDDVMIFGADWSRLRKALLDINHICRSRHLCLSAIKTKIVAADEVGNEFEDTNKDAVRYGIDIAAPSAQDELRKFFDAVVSRDPPSDRDLRFVLNQLKRTYDDYAVSWLLKNMSELPQNARTVLLYLARFHESRPEIDVELSAMLANRSFALYPFVERQVVNYFVSEVVKKRDATDACWDILEDRNKGIERDFAARYIGRFSEPGDGARLRELFERESNEHVRRAILIAYYESRACPRSLLATLAQRTDILGITARYLIGTPREIPCPSLEMIW